jgi:4-amino-4-deoxy-L-arabinose transferase-like glycosyltransferase
LALWLINVRLGFVLLKRLEVNDELLHVATFALACLLPTYVFVSSAINNDNLMITLATGLMCLMAGKERGFKNSLGLGILLGLALWVKQSAVVFVPAIGLLLLLEVVRRNITWRAGLANAGLALGLAALMYSPWAVRNWHVYGTFTPEDLSAAAKTWPSMVDGLLSAAHNLAKTFWSVSGISNNIGYPFPLLGLCYGLVAIAGLAIGSKQNQKPLHSCWSLPQSPVYAALGLAILVNLILVLRFGYLYGMGQGRHLFPLLYPIALVLALGLRSIPASNALVHVVGFWIAYALSFEAFSLCRFSNALGTV